jgi:hypothetical protein
MGHSVTGLVAKPELLEAFASQRSLHGPIALTQEMAFLPLRDEDIDSFIKDMQTEHMNGFVYLSKQLASEIASASQDGFVVYIETEYFGGMGTQGAAVFLNGALVYGPKSAEIGPINEALHFVGVEISAPADDEFETVGLNRHRSTEDWLA